VNPNPYTIVERWNQGVPGVGAVTNAALQTPGNPAFQIVTATDVPIDCREGRVPLLAPANPTDGALFAVTDVYGATNGNPCPILPQGPTGIAIWDDITSSYVSAAPGGFVQGISGQPQQFFFKFYAKLGTAGLWIQL
jgi:hypothetical protein